MTSSSSADLTALIVAMDQRGSLDAIRGRLAAGEDPHGLMEECRAGMEQVGKMYESGEYFVSALIMAGEIFRQAADLLLPLMTARGVSTGFAQGRHRDGQGRHPRHRQEHRGDAA